MSQKVVMDIGNYIGRFVESDANNFIGVWRDYLRVRVSINLNQPLKRKMKLKRSAENWCSVQFQYEAVPMFYYICGLIGHNEKYCERIFETSLDQIEKPYGPWMKSEPKHRNYTLGAQWLRKGGNFPVNSPAKARDEAQGISVTVIHAG